MTEGKIRRRHLLSRCAWAILTVAAAMALYTTLSARDKKDVSETSPSLTAKETAASIATQPTGGSLPETKSQETHLLLTEQAEKNAQKTQPKRAPYFQVLLVVGILFLSYVMIRSRLRRSLKTGQDSSAYKPRRFDDEIQDDEHGKNG